MKKLSILFVSILMFSCSYIVDQAVENTIQDPETLEIAVKNNSTQTFNRIEIRTRHGYTHIFQVTDVNMYSGFQISDESYSEAEIVVQTESGFYSYSPFAV